ncbi:MFS transporter [Kibdelosporangium phytohabitans]|uniref:MFS transporter n=1 Tax=Kibdelosporangium phytohabitans TaxID=860235 RepID=A0A0N9I7Z6_9PSEU|nr:MFS transporter [Kibdelosporangium phytohabitans]ALG12395.1 MFS transporter [Kibdelosporangium phytohabitans]MBE1463975.1 MFS family permease [Kibdelosporangium phytohabitans]
MTAGAVTFRSVLAVGEFRALWFAELLSQAGDQLARVALSVLVYQRTNSAALTGLTFALTYLPTMIGGLLLAGLGDRFPRRTVMVVSDVVRAVLVAAMAIPGVPLWLLCLLLTVVVMANGPFKAAQLALLPDILDEQRYVVGLAVRNVTVQSSQVAGFAGGGLLVSLLDPYLALGLDAATFALSALIIQVGVRWRPSARSAKDPVRLTAFGSVWRDPRLRLIALVSWLSLFYIAPESLAAPYAAELGLGALAVGLIMASHPVGSIVGAYVFTRYVTEANRLRSLALMGILAGIPLVFCVFRPELTTSMILFGLTGAFSTAYTLQCAATATRLLPDTGRAQGIGLLATAALTAQGIGALVAGSLADLSGASLAVAFCGMAGVAVAIPLTYAWTRQVHTVGPRT